MNSGTQWKGNNLKTPSKPKRLLVGHKAYDEKSVKRQPAESLPLILKRTTSYAADLEICNELILDNIVLAQQLFLDD